MPYYKLTDENIRTYNGFQWELGKNYKTSGVGELCSSGWLHCYDDPLLAVLLNPIHADIKNPRLFRIKVAGKKSVDKGLKFGFTNMKLIKEIPLPQVTDFQRVAFAILCAKEVYNNNTQFNKWADEWLSGKDRTPETARAAAEAAWAAWAAEAAARAAAEAARAAEAAAWNPINLKAIAKKAMKY